MGRTAPPAFASAALRRLRERYRSSSAATVAALAALGRQLALAPTDSDAIEALRRALHRVHGSAGSYGFPHASRLAAELEARVLAWADDATLDRPRRGELVAELAAALDGAFAEGGDG